MRLKLACKLYRSTVRGAALSDLPDREVIGRLDIPTLILAWRGDPSHPLTTARALEAELPHATLEIAHDMDDMKSWPQLLKGFVEDEAQRAA